MRDLESVRRAAPALGSTATGAKSTPPAAPPPLASSRLAPNCCPSLSQGRPKTWHLRCPPLELYLLYPNLFSSFSIVSPRSNSSLSLNCRLSVLQTSSKQLARAAACLHTTHHLHITKWVSSEPFYFVFSIAVSPMLSTVGLSTVSCLERTLLVSSSMQPSIGATRLSLMPLSTTYSGDCFV